MAEEQQTTTVAVEAKPATSTTATPSDGTQKAETPAEQMIPKARFDEINNALKKFQSDAAEQAKTQAAEAEKELAAKAEWEKLAQKRAEERDALKPKAELADKLTEMVTAQYADEIKDWPAEVKAMAPDESADILTKLAWLAKAKPLATELLKDKPPIAGNGSRPKVAAPAGSKPAPVTPITDVKRHF